MASAAVVAELSVMDVVCAMTVVASVAESELDFKRLAMARIATRIAVRTIQQEVCLSVVIKAPFRPVDRRVASSTIGRESVPVSVVRLVA